MDFNELFVRFIAVLRKRRLLFALVFFATLIGAVGGAYVKPARFESQAMLMVTLESARMNTSMTDQQQQRANLSPEEIMAAQVELMTARDVTEQLVDQLPEWVFVAPPNNKWYVRWIIQPIKNVLDWVTDLLIKVRLIEPENERYERIKMLEKGLTVFPVRKAQVIEVSFRSKRPDVPQRVIEEVIAVYQERARDLRADAEGYQLYHERALELSEQLAEAEKARTDFMLANNIVDMAAERAQLLRRLQERSLKADEDRLMELLALEPEYNLLTRNAEILADSYLNYRKAADDRQLFFERDNDISARLIDPPTAIYSAYTYSRLILVLIGFAASFFVALLVVLVVEWISTLRRVYSDEVGEGGIVKGYDDKGRPNASGRDDTMQVAE